MTDKPGFQAIGRRIEELLQETGDVSPADMLMLLRRADSNQSFDLMKELERLRTRPVDPQST